MIKILEKVVWAGLFLLAVLFGSGMAILVIEAIEQTRLEVCSETKDPEVCEEVLR